MVGKITSPETTFVSSCKALSKSADSDIVTREIDDAVHCLGIARDKFCLLLSDAARYMTAAGNLLKKLYPKLFHVTCMAHLIHDCTVKVRANFRAVDELIARVKALTVKNKANRSASATSHNQMDQLVECCFLLHQMPSESKCNCGKFK